MSGIEIAGLVLGAFPLLMTALQKHKEAARILGDWWNIRRPYKECMSIIRVEHFFFVHYTRTLLGRLLYDASSLEELLANPFSDQWRSESLTSSLRDLLPTSYEIYISVIEDYHTRMVALGRELGLEHHHFQRRIAPETTTSGQRDLRDNLEVERKRVKFAFNKIRRDNLCDGLVTCNHNLQRLLALEDMSDPPPQTRSGRKTAMPPSLNQFWEHARDLYTLMHKAWSCGCCSSHGSDLLLQNKRDHHKIEFDILFTYAGRLTCQHSGPWDWKEARITALENGGKELKASDTNQTVQAVSGKNSTLASALKSTSLSRRKSRTKSVAFQGNIGPSANPAPTMPLQVEPALPQIGDLCAKLAGMKPDDTELGLLADKSTKFSVMMPAQRRMAKSTLEYINLDVALREREQRFLSRRQRYNIALAVASAYVQLHASPWIMPDWNKSDIYLLWDSSKRAFHEQPRISRNIPSKPQLPIGVQDPSLVRLGIMLLELAFGQVLEQSPFRQSWRTANNKDDILVDKAAAEQWCDIYASEEHPHFKDPVMWCLHQSMTRTKTVKTDRSWRTDIFEKVVQPLELCCKEHSFGILDT